MKHLVIVGDNMFRTLLFLKVTIQCLSDGISSRLAPFDVTWQF
jgi:hypothetical protein